eukprot:Tamp_16702.p1 GENE.Tamp_16702~~Tamp_16702.p1  ORF type:complete len:276 (-),score=19.59 Tamp_16702:400-1227(-)
MTHTYKHTYILTYKHTSQTCTYKHTYIQTCMHRSVTDYVNHGINLILFNYRGVNKSVWLPIFGQVWLGELVGRYLTLERDGCVCDCETIIQYVRMGLGVRSEEVLLLGHSIGAAFSAQAAAMAHQHVNVCNSRSFSSLSAVCNALAPLFFGLDGKSTFSMVLRRLGAFLVHITGWELDSEQAWFKLHGFNWLEFSQGDHIIPPSVSLRTALVSRLSGNVGLRGGGGEVLQPPREFELENFAQQDNHNRSYTIRELRQHLSLVLTALRLSPANASL